MKRRPPRCAVENRITLPTVEPVTASPAHSHATDGRSTAIRIRSASKTPATGTPEESRMDNKRIPAGPQATKASVKWRNKLNVNPIRYHATYCGHASAEGMTSENPQRLYSLHI